MPILEEHDDTGSHALCIHCNRQTGLEFGPILCGSLRPDRTCRCIFVRHRIPVRPIRKNEGYGNFGNFIRYTAQVNSFMPAFTIPFLAWAATAAELALGVLLLVGLWPRCTALGSALLLAIFGTAMAISMGIKSPLDYSVFSTSAAALLLALQTPRGTNPEKE